MEEMLDVACKDCKNEDAWKDHGSDKVCTDCYRERRHKELEKMLDDAE